MSEQRPYHDYGILLEVFDYESSRIFGQVWTDKFQKDHIFYWPNMPVNMMIPTVGAMTAYFPGVIVAT